MMQDISWNLKQALYTNNVQYIRIYFFSKNSVSKIGDVALIRLKERADVLTHRADPSSNGMTPIDIPDMSTFRQFAGKYLIIDKSQPAQVVF